MQNEILEESEARRLCLDYLGSTQDFDCALLRDAYETIGFWAFRWNTREAVETGGKRGYLKKLGSIVVERSTRRVTLLPFAPGAGYIANPPITWPPDADPLTRDGAAVRVQLYLDAVNVSPCVVLHTFERRYGWVVYYNSERYRETGDPMDGLAGNGPVVVLKDSGDLHALGSGRPVSEQLRELEHRLNLPRWSDDVEILTMPDGSLRDINVLGVSSAGAEKLLRWVFGQFATNEGSTHKGGETLGKLDPAQLGELVRDRSTLRGQVSGECRLFRSLQYFAFPEDDGWFVEFTFSPDDLELGGVLDPIREWMQSAVTAANAAGAYVRMENASFEPTWARREDPEVIMSVG